TSDTTESSSSDESVTTITTESTSSDESVTTITTESSSSDESVTSDTTESTSSDESVTSDTTTESSSDESVTTGTTTEYTGESVTTDTTETTETTETVIPGTTTETTTETTSSDESVTTLTTDSTSEPTGISVTTTETTPDTVIPDTTTATTTEDTTETTTSSSVSVPTDESGKPITTETTTSSSVSVPTDESGKPITTETTTETVSDDSITTGTTTYGGTGDTVTTDTTTNGGTGDSVTTGTTTDTSDTTTTSTLPNAGTVAFVVGSETFKQGEQKDVPISILTVDGVSKITFKLVVPAGFKLDNFKLSDTMGQSGMLTLDTVTDTIIWQSRGGDYTPAPGEVLGYATLTCLEDTAEGVYPLEMADVHPVNAASQELKNTVMNGKLTVLPALTVVTSYKVDWVEPGRICYWSHDKRSFADAHGLDEMQTILTIYKYYVNASNQFVDASGRVLTTALYDPNAATMPVTPDMAFETKTMDVTAFTHTDDAEQSAYDVWTNEIKAQFGDGFTAAQELAATHANKYDLKFYLNTAEITDEEFKVADGAKLEVGTHNIFIGVKGDTDLDNHVTAYDATLVLTYFNLKYNSGFDDLVFADLDPAYGSDLDQLRFFVSDVCCMDDDVAPDGGTRLSALDATMILTYFNLKYNSGFDDADWADDDLVRYDFPDNIRHGWPVAL
ncbi:MAG: hypothetical protein II723_04220, partial [Oscillospiraceae bacterium]|nr:hypothetical protein [Oscillospiraceae bacterium]